MWAGMGNAPVGYAVRTTLSMNTRYTVNLLTHFGTHSVTAIKLSAKVGAGFIPALNKAAYYQGNYKGLPLR
jgi:hypothetical protein